VIIIPAIMGSNLDKAILLMDSLEDSDYIKEIFARSHPT